MVKKNIRIVFEDSGRTIEDKGGIPLSVGETIRMHGPDGGSVTEYRVAGKTVDCRAEGEDWIVDVVFTLRRHQA